MIGLKIEELNSWFFNSNEACLPNQFKSGQWFEFMNSEWVQVSESKLGIRQLLILNTHNSSLPPSSLPSAAAPCLSQWAGERTELLLFSPPLSNPKPLAEWVSERADIPAFTFHTTNDQDRSQDRGGRSGFIHRGHWHFIAETQEKKEHIQRSKLSAYWIDMSKNFTHDAMSC